MANFRKTERMNEILLHYVMLASQRYQDRNHVTGRYRKSSGTAQSPESFSIFVFLPALRVVLTLTITELLWGGGVSSDSNKLRDEDSVMTNGPVNLFQ